MNYYQQHLNVNIVTNINKFNSNIIICASFCFIQYLVIKHEESSSIGKNFKNNTIMNKYNK